MNKKYQRYINYIVNDIEPPYFKNMEEMYGLSEKEYELVLTKLYDQPVTIDDDSVKGRSLYNTNGNKIYSEYSNGYWEKYKHDSNGNKIYQEDSNGRIIDNR